MMITIAKHSIKTTFQCYDRGKKGARGTPVRNKNSHLDRRIKGMPNLLKSAE